jgi:hypothetical protein
MASDSPRSVGDWLLDDRASVDLAVRLEACPQGLVSGLLYVAMLCVVDRQDWAIEVLQYLCIGGWLIWVIRRL